MKSFFNYIKRRLLTGTNGSVPLSGLKDVRLWNDQFNKANGKTPEGRKEKAIVYPICYVEFIVNDINNYCLGVKDYFLTVRFRFGLESYKFERLDTFDFVDDFYRAIHLMRPAPVSGASVSADSDTITVDSDTVTSDQTEGQGEELIFTSFQEVFTEFDEDHNNVEVPYVDYRTRYRSLVAYQRGTAIQGLGINILFGLPNIPTNPDEGSVTVDSELITSDSTITVDSE